MKRLLVIAGLIGLLTTACSSSAGTTAATITTVGQPTTTVAAATTTAPVVTTKPAAPTTTVRVATTTTVAPTTVKPSKPVMNYAPVASPKLPGTTHAVNSDNTHPDGVYYGTIGVGGDPAPPAGSVVFELVQLFTGADCLAHFGTTDQEACVNDYGVETNPSSYVVVTLADQYISVVDSATQKSYLVSGDELYRLVQSQPPASAAPAGYSYSSFGYFVSYKGGKVTRLEQWWTP